MKINRKLIVFFGEEVSSDPCFWLFEWKLDGLGLVHLASFRIYQRNPSIFSKTPVAGPTSHFLYCHLTPAFTMIPEDEFASRKNHHLYVGHC